MRAVVLTSHGGPEVLGVSTVSDPVPASDEILVTVAATALNRADILQRKGFYPNPFPTEFDIPGMEFAGTVEKVGERVSTWQVGDQVMGIVSGGAYAEKLVIHERQAMRIPRGMSLVDAAAIPEVFITAWDALVLQGGLASGGWALVHAVASGVGTASIQICRAIGARVIGTCSSPKVDEVRRLGADVVVDYTNDDFVAKVREATEGQGVDVVLDSVGGDYLDRNVAALAVRGRIVQIGVMAGGAGSFNLGALLPKRAALIGTVLRARPLEEKIAISRRFAHEILPLFDSGVLRPVVDRRFTLGEIAKAHAYLESNANVGKVVVTVA
jgi:putative PIG3 family NAD(P)H quinone oxidoreductase